MALYRNGWLPTHTLPRPVISVGNLTVGGTGKTPVVIFLTQWLLAQGRRVAVLSRGYRRTSMAQKLLVSDGTQVLVGPDDAGDEPHLIAHRCPGAIVAVGADRYDVGQWVLERFPVDCFLLDDGYQHLALRRNLDLLLLDATDSEGVQAALPIGRLREPLAAASRASAIVLTRSEQDAGHSPVWAAVSAVRAKDDRPIRVVFRPEGFTNMVTGEARPPAAFKGVPTLLFSGIARPDSFRVMAASVGLNLVHSMSFPDHYAYSRALIDDLRKGGQTHGAQIWVTTEKDAGKVSPLLNPNDACWALRLQTDIVEGRERLERLLTDLLQPTGMEGCA